MANFPALFQGTTESSKVATPPLSEALVPDLTPAAPVKSPQTMGAPLAGGNFGALQRPASVKNAVAKGNPFDVFDAPTAANPFDVFDTPAAPNLFDNFDGNALATETKTPAEHDPEGTALGRALKRGVLRTRSALPTLAAADATRLVHDATLLDNDILRGLVAQRLNVPALPDDVAFSDPVTAGQYLIDKGFPAHTADAVMTEFEVRMQHARPLRDDDAAIADTLARGGRGLLRAQELNDRAAAIPGSASAEEFKQVLAAAPDTTLDVLKAYAQNPGTALAFLGETAAESLPQMGASAVTTLATRSPAVGAAVLGGGTLAQEYGSGVNEFFREHGVAPQTPEEAAALLRNPELMADASNRGLGRGVIIALAEMAGQGVAAKQLFKGLVKEATKDVTAQMVAGGGGEAGARAATGQEMSAKEVVTEALAEGVAAPVEVGATVYQSRKNAKAADQPPALPSGHSLSGERAGQLRTSDLQPLEASTKVPDTARLRRNTVEADVPQAVPTRLGLEGRLPLRERINLASDPSDRAALHQKWFDDVQNDVRERASHPQLNTLERRTSTKRMQEVLNELQAALRAPVPDTMLIEDRMNLLEMNLTSDRQATAMGRAERHTSRLLSYAATKRLLEHRLTNPAFGAPNIQADLTRSLRVVEALDQAERDPKKRAKLDQINAKLKRELDALDDEFSVNKKSRD